jgi:hypothetical protein
VHGYISDSDHARDAKKRKRVEPLTHLTITTQINKRNQMRERGDPIRDVVYFRRLKGAMPRVPVGTRVGVPVFAGRARRAWGIEFPFVSLDCDSIMLKREV